MKALQNKMRGINYDNNYLLPNIIHQYQNAINRITMREFQA